MGTNFDCIGSISQLFFVFYISMISVLYSVTVTALYWSYSIILYSIIPLFYYSSNLSLVSRAFTRFNTPPPGDLRL